MKLYIYMFLSLSLLFSCKSNDIVYKADSTEGDKIIFGNGGGFAGTVTSYILFDNGQMFMKAPGKENYVSHKKLERKICKQIFENADNLGLKDMTIDDPGNMYYFVEFVNKEEKKKLLWGGQQVADPILKAYYQNLFSLAKRKIAVKE